MTQDESGSSPAPRRRRCRPHHCRCAAARAGAGAAALEATLMAEQGRAVWTVRPIEDVERIRVAALLAEGMSIRDIAEETGTPKSTVHRLKKRIEQDAAARPPETAKIEAGQ